MLSPIAASEKASSCILDKLKGGMGLLAEAGKTQVAVVWSRKDQGAHHLLYVSVRKEGDSFGDSSDLKIT